MDTVIKRGRPKNDLLISQRNEEILQAATRAFSKDGYQRTDLQVVADELQLAKGTIYRYFRTKEELFLAAVDRGMNMLSTYINESVACETEPLAKISRAIFAFLQFFDDNPQILELLIQERAEFRDRHTPTYQRYREKNIEPWHALFHQLIIDGVFRDMPVEHITDVLSNLLYGSLFTGYFRRTPLLQSHADEIINIVFNGLLISPQSESHWNPQETCK